MNSEKGITLTSLVLYIAISTIVITILGVVTSNFALNVNLLKEQQMYAPQFNQFAMHFLQDVKNNKSATVQGSSKVTMEDGTVYQFDTSQNKIFRNGIEVANKVTLASFTLKTATVNSTQKNIIEVHFQSGENFNQTIRFVMRYW